jgi:uncharacterized damage-inducible protein DinB
MTTSEVLLQDYDMEIAMTRRILDRVPEDIPEFKCHEKSMALGKLAMHVATLPTFGSLVLTTSGLDMASNTAKWPDMTFRGRDALLATFDAAETRAHLAAASDANLAEHWKFSFGDRIIVDDPRSLAFRHMCFNHLIHHRAQLGVYLRLNDIPVPGLYGPSADEQFQPAK